MYSVKVGSEYDASPRRKRNAEIEIESIHAVGRCVTHIEALYVLASYCEPILRLFSITRCFCTIVHSVCHFEHAHIVTKWCLTMI